MLLVRIRGGFVARQKQSTHRKWSMFELQLAFHSMIDSGLFVDPKMEDLILCAFVAIWILVLKFGTNCLDLLCDVIHSIAKAFESAQCSMTVLLS